MTAGGGEMNRREFLVGGTAVTLAAGADAFASLTVGGSRACAAAREVVLDAREVRWEIAPGKTVHALAYNGRVPGPEIRVRERELVRVTLKNSLVEPTTVHWHGVDVPNAMDGVPDVTQQPVAPGGSFVYEFEARPAGTRWYHTHFREHHQWTWASSPPSSLTLSDPSHFRPTATIRSFSTTGPRAPGRPYRTQTRE